MWTGSLTNWQRKNHFQPALVQSRPFRVTAHLLDLEQKELGTPDDFDILDGQVDVDTSRSPSRILTLTLHDPKGRFDFGSDSPLERPFHIRRMIRVTYDVWVESLDKWIDVPVFTGPIWTMERNGAVVTLTAHGKERLAMGNRWLPRQFKKGRNKVGVIRALIGDTGEKDRHMDLPNVGGKLPGNLTVGRMDIPWEVAKRVANSMGRRLYYDGAGVLRLEGKQRRPIYTFSGSILTEPSVTFDPSNIRNVFWVLGKKKNRGGNRDEDRKRPVGRVALPPKHPLSPRSLGRNGAGRFLVHQVENQHIRGDRAALKLAKELRDDFVQMRADITFDSMPIPHLDEGDLVGVRSGGNFFQMRMTRFSIPLGVEGAPVMPVGSSRRTTK